LGSLPAATIKVRPDQRLKCGHRHLSGRQADDFDPGFAYPIIALSVTHLRALLPMSRSVDLDPQEQSGAVEVEDEMSHWLLASELESQALLASKDLPRHTLGSRG